MEERRGGETVTMHSRGDGGLLQQDRRYWFIDALPTAKRSSYFSAIDGLRSFVLSYRQQPLPTQDSFLLVYYHYHLRLADAMVQKLDMTRFNLPQVRVIGASPGGSKWVVPSSSRLTGVSVADRLK